MNEVFDYPAHYAALSNGKDADPDTVSAILDECAKFCEEVLAPINLSGDEEGCRIDDGAVTTPKGFKEAYAQYVAGGWQRSEARRGGEEGVSTCRSRWSREHEKKKKN